MTTKEQKENRAIVKGCRKLEKKILRENPNVDKKEVTKYVGEIAKRYHTKIVQDKQTRATIPQKLVDEMKITNKDKMEWEIKNKKLKGELKKNE